MVIKERLLKNIDPYKVVIFMYEKTFAPIYRDSLDKDIITETYNPKNGTSILVEISLEDL